MNSLDRALDYLASHWLVGLAVIVWTVLVSNRITVSILDWKYRRIMRRTARLRPRSRP